MTEAPPRLLYRKVPGGAGSPEPVACALRFDGVEPAVVEADRAAWSPRACALLRDLLEAGRNSGEDIGKALPHASLRAAIAATVTRANFIERDLGAPWSERPRPLADAIAGEGDLAEQLGEALGLWAALSLRSWAQKVSASDELVDAVQDMGPEAFSITRRKGDLARMTGSATAFPERRDAMLQRIAGALEGRELFEGLGTAWRVIRAHGASNEIEFVTSPQRERDALQSMVARLTVETIPFSSDPIVTVRASRRRWLAEMPGGRALAGQRSIGITLMSRSQSPVALETAAPVRGGVVQEPISPEFLALVLKAAGNPGDAIADMVARGAGGQTFAGVAYSPKLGGSHPLGAGASTRDQLDLFDTVLALLREEGFAAINFEETATTGRAPKRAPELHKALEAEALLSDVAASIGRNDLDDDAAIAAAWQALELDGDAPTYSPHTATRARSKLGELRAVNTARVARAFGDRKPRVVLVARTEAERTLLSKVVGSLFGQSLDVEERALPEAVHGPRDRLPAADRKPRERFEARVEAWRPLCERLARIDEGSHALVQAADWYERKPDDRVNKLAGRFALAALANANVQYLRPRASGQRGFVNYLHRVQAAVYDLVFGHSGLVSDVSGIVAGAFPDEATRPDCIVGISVLTQARTRLGTPAGRLCIATRIDTASNLTTAKVGWHDGEMRWSTRWEPLFSALKRIASPEVTASLGQGAPAERASFQLFVSGILDGCVEEGDSPLVLIDSTTASALWPWLADARLGSEPTLGAERLIASERWPGARIVRIRRGHAAHVAERKSGLYHEVDPVTGADLNHEVSRYRPTITARTIRLSGGAGTGHYWTTAGYFQMSLPRGLSVYRTLASFIPVAKVKGLQAPPGDRRLLTPAEFDISDVSYRLPNPIETSVALLCPGDDPDRIAHLVASLREGYGHTAASTSLPAPLSFESKALDYMTRFGLDAAEDEQQDEAAPSDLPAPPGPAGETEEQDLDPADAEPSLVPTDPRAWRNLLERKGSSLMDGTSLSSGLAPIDPLRLQGTPVPTAAGPGSANPPAPDDAADEDAEPTSELPTSTGPVLRIPDFVTTENLRAWVNVTNGQLRAMHECREDIRRISGYANWPEAKPDLQRFLELLPDALRHPHFLATITQAVWRQNPAAKREHWTAFNPVWKTAWRQTAALDGASLRSVSSKPLVDRLVLLADNNLVDLAMAEVLHVAFIGRLGRKVHKLVESDFRFAPLRDFVADVKRELFRSDYSWTEDLRHLVAPAPEDQEAAPEAEAEAEHGMDTDEAMQGTADLDAGEGQAEGDALEEPEGGSRETPDAPPTAPAADPTTLWRAAMGRVSSTAMDAMEPDRDTIGSLEAELKAARDALEAFEAAKPRLVDASEAIAMGQSINAAIERLLVDAQAGQGAGFSEPPGTPMLAPDALEELEAGLGELKRDVEAARTLLDEALGIMRDLVVARLSEAATLRGEAVARARDAGQRLEELVSRARETQSVPTPPRQALVGGEEITVAAREMAGDRREPSAAVGQAPDAAPAPQVQGHAPNAETSNPAVPVQPAGGGGAAVTSAQDSIAAPNDSEWEQEDYEPDDELAFDEASIDTTAADTSPATAQPTVQRVQPAPAAPDPLGPRITARLRELVQQEQFSLAYHLRLAAAAAGFGDGLPISQSELRLAAISGHLNHAAMQGSELLHGLLADVLARFEALDDDEPDAEARRILALGYTAQVALYHVDPGARLVLDALRQVAEGIGDAAHSLRVALSAPITSGLTLTPAVMRLAREDAEDVGYLQEVREQLLGELDEFAKKTYKFQLGVKLRNVLSRSDGELGRLQERIGRGGAPGLTAAREFATAFSERNAVLHLLESAENRTGNYKITGIDGVARDRMVGAIQGIAGLCAEYAEAGEAAPALRGMRQSVQRTTTSIVTATTALIEALDGLQTEDALTAAATRFAARALNQLLDSVRGVAPLAGTNDHLVAVHGPLLWVTDLDFGQSWLPSPYIPEQIAGILLDLPASELPGATPEAFSKTVDRRLARGSHIGAAMLIEAGEFYGIPVAERRPLGEALSADAQTRRDALAVEVLDTRLLVDRLQRMGGTTSQDEAQSLLSLLDRIAPEDLPVVVSAESRTEAAEDRQILDFAAAYDVIKDVRNRVAGLLQRPRDALLARIERLKGASSEEDLNKVRGLVSRDDLLTATEYVEFLENGRALPESSSPNPRFDAFFPSVPLAISAMPREERDRLGGSIAAGVDVGPLLFSRVPPERRSEAGAVLGEWRELRRAVAASAAEAGVAGQLVRLLGHFGVDAEIRSLGPRGNKRFYTADLRFVLPLDKGSVLLPDFGSLTGGDYRVCVTAKMPTEAELNTLRRDAGILRLVVFLTDSMSVDRRNQLLLTCQESESRLLIIDDALVTFAVSEPELRGQTLFECAQPFSFAEPYRDYGNAAVPREIFFGRTAERRKLLEPHGSCIVYGGRRLGKTALLRHIQAENHDLEAGTAVAYVSILDLGHDAGEEQIWEYMSRELKGVFQKPVDRDERFSEEVRRWLDVDSKRRILVLLDESDRFIQADADRGFVQFVRLQRLMDDTSRRFKFVLAGLHNVTRLVHTENPPLKQIASDPQRIGPLMDEELGDAEALVVKPLAGMGYQFESREDVWRILSYCNYYPVLVQKFCKELAQELRAQTLKRRKPITRITADHVRRALEDDGIAKEIGETFDYTISKIEDRYALIANIVADRAIRDAASNRIGEGMSAVEVRDAASLWWRAAFREANRLAIVEDLLDEMEGLGVLRRTPSGKWALRSPTILRLLGDDDKIAAKLGEFMDREAQPVFDPRSMRRQLKADPRMSVNEGDLDPLTRGQEHDILNDRVAGTIVFGNQLSNIAQVSGALRSTGTPADGGKAVDVAPRSWASKEALLKELRSNPGDRVTLHVVDQSTRWTPDWIEDAIRAKPLRDGRTRVLFVGGPEHALEWVKSPATAVLSRDVRIIALQTWSSTLTDHMLQKEHLDPDYCKPALRAATGGFNRPMKEAFDAAGTQAQFVARLKAAGAKRLADPALPTELGLVGPMLDLFSGIVDYASGQEAITAYEIEEGPLTQAGLALSGLRAVEFGVLMALLEVQPGTGEADDVRPHRLNPLLVAALTHGRA